MAAAATAKPLLSLWFMLLLPSFLRIAVAYRPGDIVPMSCMGQYHSVRSHFPFHSLRFSLPSIRRRCISHYFFSFCDCSREPCGRTSLVAPIFAVNREVLMPIPKPTGYTGADAYKILFQVGREKFLIPWLLVVNRKSTEVPMIEVDLRYSGNDLHGVTAKVVDMPHHYVEVHPEISKQFWDSQHWPKHILVRYTWKEHSEIDVTSGFFVLFGSGLMLSFILSIYVLQSSRDKLERFVRETVVESSVPGEVVAKVE
ncbi:hypothetical protein glysoja_005240 [Glycine soja]|nr:hypothetical protein glysoja_005240 [Glycine soja]